MIPRPYVQTKTADESRALVTALKSAGISIHVTSRDPALWYLSIRGNPYPCTSGEMKGIYTQPDCPLVLTNSIQHFVTSARHYRREAGR